MSTGASALTGASVPISAAVIGEGIPLLERGDIIDVYLFSSEKIDYSQGRASIILQRICSVRDEACINELRKTQGGWASGMEIKELYPFATHRKLSPPFKSDSCARPRGRTAE